MTDPLPTLGVVIVSFNSGMELLECLETLMVSEGVRLDIVVVDNASTDNTVQQLRDWAAGTLSVTPEEYPFTPRPLAKPVHVRNPEEDPSNDDGHRLTLIAATVNSGYAGGVNHGLRYLRDIEGLGGYWVLNPDTIVPPDTARTFAMAAAAEPEFALMGGRVIYLEEGDPRIQSDGGRIGRRSGITRSVHQFASAHRTAPPNPADIDFVSGASMVASPIFLERAGLMEEDYFLYYEEVDWALKRGTLPLALSPEATVYHRAGTSIGSGRPGRPATPFSLYFIHRNRLRFVRRHFRKSLAGAYAYSLAKAGQLLLKGQLAGATALLLGTFGMAPTSAVRDKVSPAAQTLAFSPEQT